MSGADGSPVSYLALAPGTPVYSADGVLVGTVERVLQVPAEDLFTGLAIATSEGPRHVPRDDIASLAERAVRLRLDATEARQLSPPSGPPVFKADPGEGVGRSFRDWWKRHFSRGGWKRVE
jgi:hypothetical protein